MKSKKIALFASGSGTNAQKIIEYFSDNEKVIIDSLWSNLKERNINLIVLAGFLWLVPLSLIQSFPIINIHPALLPKYGGKGMYGMKVHQAVVDNKEKESGITIHYVNEVYDDGKIIFQAKCAVDKKDTAEDVARKIHKLEYRHFPQVIEKVLREI